MYLVSNVVNWSPGYYNGGVSHISAEVRSVTHWQVYKTQRDQLWCKITQCTHLPTSAGIFRRLLLSFHSTVSIFVKQIWYHSNHKSGPSSKTQMPFELIKSDHSALYSFVYIHQTLTSGKDCSLSFTQCIVLLCM